MSPFAPTGYVPRQDSKAVAALILGIVGMVSACCYGGLIFGIPAMVLGALSLRDIKRSEGTLGGQGLAVGGIVTGSLGLLLFVGQLVLGVASFFLAMNAPAAHTILDASPPPVVVITPGQKPLREVLRDEKAHADIDHRVLVLQTTGDACAACREVEAELSHVAMGTVMEKVRWVRVSVDDFGPELSALGVVTEPLPGFFLLDGDLFVKDGISANEWGENKAWNMEPVLESFVDGTLATRRAPFSREAGAGGIRDAARDARE